MRRCCFCLRGIHNIVKLEESQYLYQLVLSVHIVININFQPTVRVNVVISATITILVQFLVAYKQDSMAGYASSNIYI